MTKTRIALIYGGKSGEHAISCVTAGAIMRAMDPQRYEVLPIGITRDGNWVPGHADLAELSLDRGLPEVPDSAQRIVIPAGDGSQSALLIEGQNVTDLGRIDVAFPVLHGPFGEDGTVQGLLEMAGIAYVGCGVLASAAGMDKHFMKVILADAGLPVSPYVTITAQRWATEPQAVRAQVANLTFPLYVKPARAGSSLGISKITDIAQLDAAIAQAQEHDPKVLVEEEVRGREVECAVREGRAGQPPCASELGEIIIDSSQKEFYDFEHKYVATDSLTLTIPAQLEESVSERAREYAVRAFSVFGCEGLTRVDFFITPDGDPIINEINTMPGFTPFSMYPALWEAAGMSYSDLVDELIALAQERPRGLR
ncbi:D-alanine--D-alanine ligase family protein [Trueperella sp. LYQ143]|uniref:D-alanine--D-alanine ligase family protein n=1 Tax=Trueperella sp. LYQ143 TaxID=3391059 RepID=UPI003983B188